MILPDVNLLVYAYDVASPWHSRASHWWISSLNGNVPVALSWIVALGFIRLWTNPKIFAKPMSVEQAAGFVESWLNRRIVQTIHPGPRHAELLFSFLRSEGKGGNLTTDAHIAALAIENRATVYSSDTDFLRFEGLKYVNPLT